MSESLSVIKVDAVIVTFNRKELLMECLDALLAQTYPLHKIILIDNASTDGTEDALTENGYFKHSVIEYHKMQENTGGAGGFYEGIRIAASRQEAEFIWVMDDDTIPTRDALKGLVVAQGTLDEKIGFLASCVYGPAGEPMNVPNISETKGDNGYRDWYTKMPYGAVRIADATFVSLLIPLAAVRYCGLPCRDYFIWGDDSEYTMRLIKYYGPAYLIGDSIVCHKRFNAKALSISNEENKNRIRMFRYFYRNNLINRSLYQGKKAFFRFYFGAIRTLCTGLFKKNGGAKAKSILSGISSYHREKGKFKEYIQKQLHQSGRLV